MFTKSYNFLYRELVDKLIPFVDKREILVILGARQVGKTSLLHYLESMLRRNAPTFYLDLEDIEPRKAIESAHDLIEILKAMGYETKTKAYVLLDEAHYLKNAESILKVLRDHYPEW